MRLSLTAFHKLRIITAAIVLFLALIYLSGLEAYSLAGFAVLTVLADHGCGMRSMQIPGNHEGRIWSGIFQCPAGDHLPQMQQGDKRG